MKEKMLKTVVWQIFSLVYSVVVGRIWFGYWEVGYFMIFLTVSLTPILYVYDKLWIKKFGEKE